MSEIRKPCLIILLKKDGKCKYKKIELFEASLWDIKEKRRYRIRYDGKWFDKGKLFYKTEFMNVLAKSIL